MGRPCERGVGRVNRQSRWQAKDRMKKGLHKGTSNSRRGEGGGRGTEPNFEKREKVATTFAKCCQEQGPDDRLKKKGGDDLWKKQLQIEVQRNGAQNPAMENNGERISPYDGPGGEQKLSPTIAYNLWMGDKKSYHLGENKCKTI